MTRNEAYEQRKKATGLTKITIWVPSHAECDFKEMADRCCENRDLIPAGVKSKTTGRMVKLI